MLEIEVKPGRTSADITLPPEVVNLSGGLGATGRPIQRNRGP
ncbi:MAG: hypothetical protein U0514_01250 [Candidatus Andersenbacteria bacterium]